MATTADTLGAWWASSGVVFLSESVLGAGYFVIVFLLLARMAVAAVRDVIG